MSDNNINIEIHAQDKATPAFKGIIAALKGVEIAADGGAEKMTKFARALQNTEIGPVHSGFLDLEGALKATFEVMRDGYRYVAKLDRGLQDLRDGASNIGKPAQMMAKYKTSVSSVLAPTKSLGLATQSLIAQTTGIAGNAELGRLNTYYGRLERASEATQKMSGKSRVLTTTVGKMIDEQMGFKKSVEQTKLAEYITGLDKAGREAEKLAAKETKVEKATKAIKPAMKSAVSSTKSGMSDMVKFADGAAGHIMSVFKSVGRVVRRGVLVGIGAAAGGMALLAKTGVQYNGQMDTYTKMMTTYLGDSAQAKKLLVEAQLFAIKTPLDTTQVMKTATMMIQYDNTSKSAAESSRKAMEVTKNLAQVSGGSTEKMNLLGIALAQVSAKTKLQAEEVRQLTNAGYNPLKTISKQTGKSMKDLYKEMKAGKISFDMVASALKEDTSQGGKFYNTVFNLSKTLPGAVGNIKEMTRALIGNVSTGFYKWLTKVAVQTQNYMAILTEGILRGRGWAASLHNMTAHMRLAGGAASRVADVIDRINNSKFANFVRNFKRDVKAELAKGATFKVAIRRSLEKTQTGSTMVGAFDGAKNMLKALAPMVKGALNFMGPLLAEVGKRVVKVLQAFKEMAPFFTNVIGPIIIGVFKGILSIVDPLISILTFIAPAIGKVGTEMKPLKPWFEKLGYVIGMFFGGPILAGIGKFTKGFGLVGKAVRPLGLGLMKVGEFVFKLVGGVMKFSNAFLHGFAAITVKGDGMFAFFALKFLYLITMPARLYVKFAMFVGKMALKFLGAVPRMANGFFKFVDGMGGRLGKMVRGFIDLMIKGLLMIRGKFGSFAKFIGTAIGQGVISIINKVIKQINKLFDGVEKIINKIPGVDVNMPTIGTIGGGGSSGGGGDAGSVTKIASAAPVPAGTLGGGGQFDPFGAARSTGGDIVVKIDGREVGRVSGKQIVRKAARA